MKKIALTSLLAVFAAAGANAANVIDGNPLYMPRAGHFYSVTDLYSHSENSETWTLGEEFGFGVSDFLAVDLRTSASEVDSFDGASWNDLSLGLTMRMLDRGAWKADLYGRYGVGNVWPDHRPFLAEEDTFYAWTVGVRGGYVTTQWTLAGHVAYTYTNSESFNWGDDGWHELALGLDGQFVIDSNWNLTAGIEYTGREDAGKNAGTWEGTLGVNYNIDATKYVGAWVSTGMHHRGGDAHDEWEFADGVGYGIKFGIDF